MNDIKYYDAEIQNYTFLLNLKNPGANSNYIDAGDVYNLLMKSKLSKV